MKQSGYKDSFLDSLLDQLSLQLTSEIKLSFMLNSVPILVLKISIRNSDVP